MLSPSKDHKPVNGQVDNWTVGHIFSRTELFGPKAKWFNHNIMLSIKPGETWQECYFRQRGEAPEPRMLCFWIDR